MAKLPWFVKYEGMTTNPETGKWEMTVRIIRWKAVCWYFWERLRGRL